MGEIATPNPSTKTVDILILGLGWTSKYLVPLLKSQNISYIGTTTTGRSGSQAFKFEPPTPTNSPSRRDPTSINSSLAQYRSLPTAKTLLITFPIRGKAAMEYFWDCYHATHDHKRDYHVILLGSSGIYQIPGQEVWVERGSRYMVEDERAQAEDWLMGRGGCALDLSGLWGGERQVKHWIDRVAKTKEELAGKKALHMIHGLDVARAILAVHGQWAAGKGQRWLLTDMVVYDWWELILAFGGEIDIETGENERAKTQCKWVGELMRENNVRALPRSIEQLGRGYDVRGFWEIFGLMPTKARLSSTAP